VPSPPPLQAPAPLPLDVPGLQPPATVPTGDALLNPITDALAGIEAALPLR
jgi:hypothetical protein